MKFLHTSDWHIGRALYGRKRYDEFAAFLDWLIALIHTDHIDLLLISGDIFDTTTPSNRAQELYYRFLCRTAASPCRHVVVTAGNHDSPSFLNAPRELLKALDVHVIGSAMDNPEDEVLLLKTPSGEPEIIVCAVPYLRDRDVRRSEAGESISDKHLKLIQGVKDHYTTVCGIAQQKKTATGKESLPIVAMGHLFTAGGKTIEGDGVRELYVGTLAHVGVDAFPPFIDYVALGHLHLPQKVAQKEHIRYCGSPIPMGYGEAKQEKKVVVVDVDDGNGKVNETIQLYGNGKLDGNGEPPENALGDNFSGDITPRIKEVTVPCFQPLERISGTLEEITDSIETLKATASSAWLEIEYTGSEIAATLRETIDQAVAGSKMEVRRIKNQRMVERVLSRINEHETLDDLNEDEVFCRCLDHYNIPKEERPELIMSYKEIITALHEEDLNAE